MELGMVLRSGMDLGKAHSNVLRLWYPVKFAGSRVPKSKCCSSLLPEEVSSANNDTLTNTSSVLTILEGGEGSDTTMSAQQ